MAPLYPSVMLTSRLRVNFHPFMPFMIRPE